MAFGSYVEACSPETMPWLIKVIHNLPGNTGLTTLIQPNCDSIPLPFLAIAGDEGASDLLPQLKRMVRRGQLRRVTSSDEEFENWLETYTNAHGFGRRSPINYQIIALTPPLKPRPIVLRTRPWPLYLLAKPTL